jgi:hypothetical protein
LDNVNNTSDANKPVSIAQQDALNAKVDENAPITAGTAPKITFDAKGLVTSGDSLDETDLPTGINANKIGTGAVSSTEFGYLDGVTSAIQTQIDGKQATLVSGTNIKTINSTSLLGSGDIAISATPSGVAGAIQFSNGSAFASDAANLFWDDTNNRLGVGTNAPQSKTEINSAGNQLLLSNSGDIYTYLKFSAVGGFASMIFGDGGGGVNYLNNYSTGMWASNKFAFGPSLFAPSAQVHIKGSGSTSATTSLLVQNSAGAERIRVFDSNLVRINGGVGNITNGLDVAGGLEIGSSAYLRGLNFMASGLTIGDNAVNFASAILEVKSTTQGFLPPRMTTTQINAIASPANGLEVYNTTLNCPCFYNGTSWRQVTNSAM